MRVVIVTTWWPNDDQPGMAPFNVAHAKAIARHHDVRVVRVQRKVEPRRDTVDPSGLPLTTVSVNPADPLATVRGLNELRKLVKGADIVHTLAYDAVTVLAPLYPLIKKRWVHTEHWSAFVSNQAIIPPRVRKSMRLPRRVSTVSNALREALLPFTGDGEITVIPNVIADHFTAVEQPSWDPLKLVAVGMLIERKRPLLAVETVAELVRGGQDTTLTWVGDGPLMDDVRTRAAELGVAERVHLVGAVPAPEVAGHLSAANLFFLPTAGETFLVAAAEAIAGGRPVVLPRLACLDYVTEQNGVLVDGADAAAFAAAITEAAKAFRDRSAEEIRSTVIPRFDAESVGKHFDSFYSGLGA
ncbi:glycosyltransferase [Actinokineospora sp. UTMC 2448]|uniref:glycosyltransferase n=1 Tax=Actinokineospora sp. UTMC 2448 TaxID=2268449 RepID=UPI0021641D85|nr:glycosyltransferase [Actinokineospora sp. UTMC 2448]UVS82436.1 GDP-mannose-dependent alpha-(1-6)-phosphatidylinositol monomannoside mannosyltransferase [Actinokineospora sp. UTMC 2448]